MASHLHARPDISEGKFVRENFRPIFPEVQTFSGCKLSFYNTKLKKLAHGMFQHFPEIFLYLLIRDFSVCYQTIIVNPQKTQNGDDFTT